MRWLVVLLALGACRKEPVPVWIVNGLDVSLDANVSGQRLTVPANGHASITVKKSKFWVVVTLDDGTEIDRETIERRTDDKPVVFNVLGASPLAIHGVMYAFFGVTMDKPEASQELWYQRVLERGGIDFYFDAPAEVPKGEKPGPVEKLELAQAGGWSTTVQWLYNQHRFDDAIKLATAVQTAQPDRQDVATIVAQLRFAVRQASSRGYTWVAPSFDQESWLVHEQTADGHCTMRCEQLRGGVEWKLDGCIATAQDQRFVSPACAVTVIVRRQLPKGDALEPSDAVLEFERDALVLHEPATDAIVVGPPAANGDLRYRGFAQLSADGRNVEIPDINGRRLISMVPR